MGNGMNLHGLRTYRPLADENGYMALFAAIALLILLTIIGISASQVADTELAMARNEVIHHRNFYLAEGAAIEAADRLSNTADLKADMPTWMETTVGTLDYDSLRAYFAGGQSATVVPQASVLDLNRTLFLGAVEGTAAGEGLDPDRPKIHSIAIYGRCEWEGVAIVKLGYRAAY